MRWILSFLYFTSYQLLLRAALLCQITKVKNQHKHTKLEIKIISKLEEISVTNVQKNYIIQKISV